MATLIRRTNPDRLRGRGANWACAACREPYATPEEARHCAEIDHGYVQEYKHNRNFIHVGDTVKCKPLSGSSFEAKVLRIRQVGKSVEVEVLGQGKLRTFRPDRITRKRRREDEGGEDV